MASSTTAPEFHEQEQIAPVLPGTITGMWRPMKRNVRLTHESMQSCGVVKLLL